MFDFIKNLFRCNHSVSFTTSTSAMILKQGLEGRWNPWHIYEIKHCCHCNKFFVKWRLSPRAKRMRKAMGIRN